MEIKGKPFWSLVVPKEWEEVLHLSLARLGANVMFCDLNAEKIAEVEAAGAGLSGGVKGMVLNVAEA